MWGRMLWVWQYPSRYLWTSCWGRKLFRWGSKGKSGNIITSLGRLVLSGNQNHSAGQTVLTSPADRGATTRCIPEVSVHAAVDRPAVIVRSDSFIVTPGAADVVGELEHHRGGEDVRAGQDVSGCTESRRPGADHRQPLHHPHPDGESQATGHYSYRTVDQ